MRTSFCKSYDRIKIYHVDPGVLSVTFEKWGFQLLWPHFIFGRYGLQLFADSVVRIDPKWWGYAIQILGFGFAISVTNQYRKTCTTSK